MEAITGNVFAAEYIKKSRKRKAKIEYLIKWKGWSAKYDSWEPPENILDNRLIQDFERRKGRPINQKTSAPKKSAPATKRAAKRRLSPSSSSSSSDESERANVAHQAEPENTDNDDEESGGTTSAPSSPSPALGAGGAPAVPQVVAPLVIKISNGTPTTTSSSSRRSRASTSTVVVTTADVTPLDQADPAQELVEEARPIGGLTAPATVEQRSASPPHLSPCVAPVATAPPNLAPAVPLEPATTLAPTGPKVRKLICNDLFLTDDFDPTRRVVTEVSVNDTTVTFVEM